MGITSQPKVQGLAEAGYIKEVYIIGGDMEGAFMIKPDTDLDSRFKAWALDWGHWAWVSGWACDIEEVEA